MVAAGSIHERNRNRNLPVLPRRRVTKRDHTTIEALSRRDLRRHDETSESVVAEGRRLPGGEDA